MDSDPAASPRRGRTAPAPTAKATGRALEALVEHAGDLVLVVTEAGEVGYASPSIARLLGHHPDDVVGRPLGALLAAHGPDDPDGVHGALDGAAAHAAGPLRLDARFTRADGSTCELDMVVTDARADARVGGWVIHGRDATDRRRRDAELRRRALHDVLTGLATRPLLLHGIEALHDAGHERVAVVVFGLDRFNVVNDSLGHDVGDVLLQRLAERLRIGAGDGMTVARLGGDTFAVAAPAADDDADTTALAERLLRGFTEPVDVGPQWVSLGARAGIAVGERGDEPSAVIRNADAAMYHAKRSSFDRLGWYEPEKVQHSARALDLEQGLRHAVVKDELAVHYQPIVDLADGRAVGVEALVRWHHPELGTVPPLEFIPLAEQTGEIVNIGLHVLREACRTVAEWRRLGQDLNLSVNLSPRQLLDSTFTSKVADILADTGMEPAALTMEITESVLVEEGQFAAGALDRLRALGLRLSIDDFGTGYSSLLYLRRIRADTLKIDRSFVDGLGRDPEDEAIVATVINLATSLGLKVVAEGVETEDQRQRLAYLGSGLAQGYLFSRPLDATAFAAWAAEHVRMLSTATPYVPFAVPGQETDEVDELTRAQADAGFYRALVEEAAHASVVFDGAGTLTYATRLVEPMFGARVPDDLGSNIADWVEPDELGLVIDALAHKTAHPDAEMTAIELSYGRGRRRRRMEAIARDDADMASDAIAVVVRDVTPRLITEEIIRSALRSEPIEQTLGVIADLAHEQIRTSGATIAFGPDGSSFEHVVGAEVGEGLRAFARRCGVNADAGLPWEVAVREDRPCEMIDRDLPPRLRAAAAAHGYLGCWSVPIMSPTGGMLGAFTVWTHDTVEPGPPEKKFLGQLAEMASFAIDRWAQDRAVSHAAGRDELTGLVNRWRFEEALEGARAADDAPLGVVLLDLDDFARVNDWWGRAAADRLLVTVAERLGDVVRPGDTVARFGGDLFAVLCNGADDASMADLADRLLAAVEAPLDIVGEARVVRASAGLVVDDRRRSEASAVLADADRALGRAKVAGRGRWERAA